MNEIVSSESTEVTRLCTELSKSAGALKALAVKLRGMVARFSV